MIKILISLLFLFSCTKPTLKKEVIPEHLNRLSIELDTLIGLQNRVLDCYEKINKTLDDGNKKIEKENRELEKMINTYENSRE